MDIDAYCLPDWPSGSSQLITPMLTPHMSKSAKSPRYLPISSKQDSTTTEFLQPTEREQIIRRFSARKSEGEIFLDWKKEIV